MNLYEKSLKTLELPAVLEMLSREAASQPAKEKALSVRPSGDPAEVRRRLGETTAARSMMAVKGSPSFSGVKDVRSALARADMGGMLNPRELLDIAGVLQSARLVRSYGEGDRSQPTEIDYLFRSLRTNRFLEDKITGCITEEEEIADSASPELASIRRLIRATNSRIRETLQKIISSPSYSKVLQEPIITTRSERYVVPVKAEHKGAVPGLVHDVSASGATLFIEPMAVVKANNELRELRAKEKQEIERILMELSADCAAQKDDIASDFSLLVELDVIFAKAKLSYKLKCTEPVISETGLKLRQARHPLLNQETAVPIDVELGDGFDTLVITGPNTGGKTVSLKTIGLLSVMAQCGLHIPASDGSSLPVFKAVLADIGDEQSIQQSLSTFSSHMTNIVNILRECGPDTLLLFDELGAGTDPVEGAALAIAIIEYARKRGSLIAATTHYAELKVYATSSPGVQNASCEFDIETLQPTYRLLLGIPGKSNAFAISERLGMPEEIIEDSKGRVGIESASFEETIEKLEQARQLIERDRLEEAKKLRETEENLKKSEQMRRELAVRLEKAEERARREAERILEEARREAEEVFAQLDEMRKRQAKEEDYQRINEARALLRRKLNEAEERLTARKRKPVREQQPSRPVRPGDTVEILPMGIKATVISVDPERGLELQAGIMRVTAKESEVLLLEDEPANKLEKYIKSGTSKLNTASVSPELDIRGMMTDEAIPVLERYLDSAAMANLSSVTIIHGKGTGALRQAVHDSLKRNKVVKGFRLGRFGEGETGVTIVELK
ncbi:MAG: endonuclease MutS2 [Oscillospiraceae bacterium]|jgi:DNA mismatch repair protein MutS2